jgi:hypothetical protein
VSPDTLQKLRDVIASIQDERRQVRGGRHLESRISQRDCIEILAKALLELAEKKS